LTAFLNIEVRLSDAGPSESPSAIESGFERDLWKTALNGDAAIAGRNVRPDGTGKPNDEEVELLPRSALAECKMFRIVPRKFGIAVVIGV
jgi:hypothetical protein